MTKCNRSTAASARASSPVLPRRPSTVRPPTCRPSSPHRLRGCSGWSTTRRVRRRAAAILCQGRREMLTGVVHGDPGSFRHCQCRGCGTRSPLRSSEQYVSDKCERLASCRTGLACTTGNTVQYFPLPLKPLEPTLSRPLHSLLRRAALAAPVIDNSLNSRRYVARHRLSVGSSPDLFDGV